ncbi:hypothetical protein GCM10010421_52660 [Streptomyces glaucus]|uniref:Secreted protein n=1 Tax=Streptomyces glaucus TaxID=284029 RepID=A0ABP5XGE1_9ACTN
MALPGDTARRFGAARPVRVLAHPGCPAAVRPPDRRDDEDPGVPETRLRPVAVSARASIVLRS